MLRRYQIRGRRTPIPAISSSKAQSQPIDYTAGLHNGKPNDLQPKNTLRYVTDKRFNGVGKYKTRQGCDHYSVAVGETVNVQVTSTTGASNAGITSSTRYAEKVTATATGVLTRIDVNLKNSASATGTVIVELYSNNSGVPGDLLSSSSVPESSVATTYGYKTTYHMKAPDITNGSIYWVVAYLQDSGTGTMYISSTTNSTNAKVSTDQGQSWSASSFSLNVKLYTSTAGGVKGVRRVVRPDGTAVTFFAHASTVYKVSDVDGSLTSVDTGIDATSTVVRFEYVNDVLYYVDGKSKPRKYDFSASSQITAAPGNASDLIEHVGIMFYLDVADRTKVWYSNFAAYETFTSTDFIYVPAPKKSDWVSGFSKLNGVLYMHTKRNKYMLMGADNATFSLHEAYAQKGTFSQESIAFDENFVYFAAEDGVYKFNGSAEKNIAEPIITEYMDIRTKTDIHLQLYNNRLYIFFRPNDQALVSKCYVYNTLYDVMESLDLNTWIGHTFAREDTSGLFLQASNRAGVIYYGEQATNDYNNLGDRLSDEVRTAYDHFGSPQQRKRIRYWRPLIESVAGSYTLQAGFAADYSNDTTFSNVVLQGTGYRYDSASATYDTATYATNGSSTDTTLNIFGTAYRWQRVYKHYAAREPVEFAGEVLKTETMRMR